MKINKVSSRHAILTEYEGVGHKGLHKSEKKKKDFMEDTRCEVERTTVERFTE